MPTAYDFTIKTITGHDKKLSDYKGKVLLVVNVASHCGYTPQYKGLEVLHKTLGPKGLAILGIPCNQFGAQEPGTEAEIQAFCDTKYGISFDMFSKIDVNGTSAHPLYRWLTSEAGGPVKWNFTKFLISKDGKVLGRFESATKPESPELREEVAAALR